MSGGKCMGAEAETGTEVGSHDYCRTEEGRWAAVVRRYIADLRFGEVVLTIHDGRVVQIEKKEKVRF